MRPGKAGAGLAGGFADPPRDAAQAFRAAMEAMARPGRLHQVPGTLPPSPLSQAAGTLLLTLVDADTPLHLAGAADNAAVRGWVTAQTGAPLVGPGAAAFALGSWPALCPLDRYPAGTPDYPDRSATLIVEMAELANRGARLAGPGIAGETALDLPDIDAFAWNAARFPLGLDFFFCAGRTIAALPRSTTVTAGGEGGRCMSR
jgi:alpha-D-ribose 1-methylphosphonate 5-triphosphate synthase subunit PhnH